MENEIKEFNLKLVEKYNNEIDIKKKGIASDKFCTGIFVLATIASAIGISVVLHDLEPSSTLLKFIFFSLFTATGSLKYLFSLIKKTARKSGLEIRLEEIKEFFKQHGLELDDELAKIKGVS